LAVPCPGAVALRAGLFVVRGWLLGEGGCEGGTVGGPGGRGIPPGSACRVRPVGQGFDAHRARWCVQYWGQAPSPPWFFPTAWDHHQTFVCLHGV